MLISSIPSPSVYKFDITIHFYALCILAGMALAIWITKKRYEARGGEAEVVYDVALVSIIVGIIGARVYHVLTAWTPYFGPGANPLDAFKIWEGGIGVWGGVLAGIIAGIIYLRYRNLQVAPFADAVAPAILVAQAVGRLGNWFNQEVFGSPTTLPWGLQIDPQHLAPFGLEPGTLVHPTFLYEMIWNLLVAALIIWVDRRYRVAGGQLLALYAGGYCLGRVLMEGLRVDTTDYIGGLRINLWASILTIIFAVALYFWLAKRDYPTRVLQPTTTPQVEKDDRV